MLNQDQIHALLAALRQKKFKVGVDTHLLMHAVQQRLSQMEEEPPSATDLAPWFAPLVCRNPLEQQAFLAFYPIWLRNQYRPTPDSPSPNPPPVPPPEYVEPKKSGRGRKYGYLWLLLLLSLLASGWLFHSQYPEKIQNLPLIISSFLDDIQKMIQLNSGNEPIDEGGTEPVSDPLDLPPIPKPIDPPAPSGPELPQRPEPGYSGNNIERLAVALFIPLLTLLLVIRFSRSPVGLEKRLARQPTESPWQSRLPQVVNDHFTSVSRRTWQLLRFVEPTPWERLDLRATTEATLRNGGFPALIYTKHVQSGAYLVLVHKLGLRDHVSDLGDVLYQRLKAEDIPVTLCSFHDDPRTVREWGTAVGSDTILELTELIARHGRDRLIILSETDPFFDPVTGEPYQWLETLHSFVDCTLLTPVSVSEWGFREKELIRRGFNVLEADSNGLKMLEADSGSPAVPWQSNPLPILIRNDPDIWLDNWKPSDRLCNRLMKQLDHYLGNRGMHWLASLAVFPQLHPQLTQYMGTHLRHVDGSPLRNESLTLRLVRLPWLRHGRMPEWLRLYFIDWLGPKREGEIRKFFHLLLRDRKFHKQVVGRKGLLLQVHSSSGIKSFFHDLFKPARPAGPLGEHLFLNFMRGGSATRLMLKAPSLLDGMMRRGWHPLSPLFIVLSGFLVISAPLFFPSQGFVLPRISSWVSYKQVKNTLDSHQKWITPSDKEGFQAKFDGTQLHLATAINRYMHEHTFVSFSQVDFFQADLSHIQFRDQDLSSANLAETYLKGTDFSGALLIATDLSFAVLDGTRLNQAWLADAILTGAMMANVDLRSANDLTQVQLDDACGDNVQLPENMNLRSCREFATPSVDGDPPLLTAFKRGQYRSKTVFTLQRRMKIIGWSDGPLDGIWSDRYQKIIEQRDQEGQLSKIAHFDVPERMAVLLDMQKNMSRKENVENYFYLTQLLDRLPKPQKTTITTGQIWITSSTDGAEVLLDGKRLGKTPLSLKRLQLAAPENPDARHTLEVRLAGYQPHMDHSVQFFQDRSFKRRVILQRIFIKIPVKSNPPGATVWWNGEEKGITPITLTGALDRSYELKLHRAGYKVLYAMVTAKEGTAVDYTLNPKTKFVVASINQKPSTTTENSLNNNPVSQNSGPVQQLPIRKFSNKKPDFLVHKSKETCSLEIMLSPNKQLGVAFVLYLDNNDYNKFLVGKKLGPVSSDVLLSFDDGSYLKMPRLVNADILYHKRKRFYLHYDFETAGDGTLLDLIAKKNAMSVQFIAGGRGYSFHISLKGSSRRIDQLKKCQSRIQKTFGR